jgi:hypothetical protein
MAPKRGWTGANPLPGVITFRDASFASFHGGGALVRYEIGVTLQRIVPYWDPVRIFMSGIA